MLLCIIKNPKIALWAVCMPDTEQESKTLPQTISSIGGIFLTFRKTLLYKEGQVLGWSP